MHAFSWAELGLVMAGGALGTLIRDAANRWWKGRDRELRSMTDSDDDEKREPQGWIPADFPLATSMVNVAGCLLIGVLAGVPASPESKWLWLAGFCGGLTTFSALQWESWHLWRSGKRRMAYVSLLLNYGLGLPAAAFGWWLAGL